jgi:hypothetical protein
MTQTPPHCGRKPCVGSSADHRVREHPAFAGLYVTIRPEEGADIRVVPQALGKDMLNLEPVENISHRRLPKS